MALVVYTKSRSFEEHINTVVDGDVVYRTTLSPAVAGPGNIYLVHAASFVKQLNDWLEASTGKGVVIGVAADNPQVQDLLTYTQSGVQGYFNSYMAAVHYAQLLRLLENGQSWYPPALTQQVFDFARSAMQPVTQEDPLFSLTRRERDVALAVAEGKSNKLVATSCDMAERTVKAHLTHIFKKLEVKDRVALVIYLNQFDSLQSKNTSKSYISR